MNENPFSVLIVDDNKQNLMVLGDIMDGCGYETGFAMNGRQALEYLAQESPDLILLDVMMPEMDGYETCRILKDTPEHKDIPVIFLTAKVETEDIVKGFEAGGVDYITKPFNSLELKSRVKTHLTLKRAQEEAFAANEALKQANRSIEEKNKQLNQMITKLDILSKTDALTGLFNRRTINEEIGQQLSIREGRQIPFSVVMGDIDLFKNVNDTYGHDFGDLVLQEISGILSRSIRGDDVLSRWGGEEFLFILKDISAGDAVTLTERIRKKVEEHVFSFHDIQLHVTMTFGVSEFRPEDHLDDVVKRADTAMYRGKQSGRNRVVKAD